MARTPVLIALRRAHAARCSWMHVHLLTAPLKDPFTAQMRSKSKKFRRKRPSLYFFIYFCKINSRSLETQVCHIHDLQPTTQTLEDNKQKANAHKFFSCTSADTAQESICKTRSLTSGCRIQEILQGGAGRILSSNCSPSTEYNSPPAPCRFCFIHV